MNNTGGTNLLPIDTSTFYITYIIIKPHTPIVLENKSIILNNYAIIFKITCYELGAICLYTIVHNTPMIYLPLGILNGYLNCRINVYIYVTDKIMIKHKED